MVRPAYAVMVGLSLLGTAATALVPSALAQTCTQMGIVVPPVSPPGGNSSAGFVYDAPRAEGVLLGQNGGPLDMTWIWDGAAWSRRATAHAPSRRAYTSLAYDAGRARTVLFGGSSTVDRNDTWEFDGVDWIERDAGGAPGPGRPSARSGYRLAYDPVHRRTLLVGGFPTSSGRPYDGDTWAWDGDTWALLADAAHGPGPRGDQAMAFDEARGVLVLYGGYNNTLGVLRDCFKT